MNQEIATWFSSWERLFGIATTAVVFFVLIVLLVRVVGKRVTGQMNNFDWIITVAVGSLAASGILLRNVSVLDAVVAMVVLAGCQWFITWAIVRYDWVSTVVKPRPRLLTHKGQLIHEALKQERIAEAEVWSKLREQGCTTLNDANWIILETDGSMSVIPKKDVAWRDADLLRDVDAPTNVTQDAG